jgi:hypothetical protein
MTPTIEINVMIETKVRFGFKYRSARKKLNGSFKVARSVAANPVQFNRGVGPKNRGLKLQSEEAVMVGDPWTACVTAREMKRGNQNEKKQKPEC